MNFNFTDEELNILNKLIDDGYAVDLETALKFVIHYYDLMDTNVQKKYI